MLTVQHVQQSYPHPLWLRLDLSWNLLDSEVGFLLDSREGVEVWKVWMVKRGHQNDTKQYRYYKELLNCPKVIPWLLILSTEGSDKSMESIFYSRTAQGVFES